MNFVIFSQNWIIWKSPLKTNTEIDYTKGTYECPITHFKIKSRFHLDKASQNLKLNSIQVVLTKNCENKFCNV